MAFAQGWTDQWGRYPDATPENMHMNYQVYLCSSATGHNQIMSNDLSIALSGELADTSDEHVFNVEESILGDIRFRSFAVKWLPSDNGLATPAAAPYYDVANASVIASPDKS